MLSRRGKARTEIRGQSSHTDPDEEVLLLNFGIFTTSSCLLCGWWRSHTHTGTMCLLSLSIIKLCNFQRNQQDTFFSTALLLHGWWYSNVWTILLAFSLLLCVQKCKANSYGMTENGSLLFRDNTVFLKFGWEWFSGRCFVTLLFFLFFF